MSQHSTISITQNVNAMQYSNPNAQEQNSRRGVPIWMNEYVYSQTTAATTVQCTTSVQQIGQRQTESTNRKAPLMQHMNNVTHLTNELDESYNWHMKLRLLVSKIVFRSYLPHKLCNSHTDSHFFILKIFLYALYHKKLRLPTDIVCPSYFMPRE